MTAAALGVATPILLAGAAVVLLAAVLFGATAILWRRRAAFFAAYAKERGLSRQTYVQIPESTALLRRGDTRHADEALSGTLPGGLDGTLALYTYEERGVGGSGGTNEIHHFTVVVAPVPDLKAKVPALFVQRRSGFRFLDGAEDVFRRTKRIELESEELDRKCEIFADPSSDDIWLRQLFSPSFVDLLASKTPDGFGFEIENGALCVNVNRQRNKAGELDALAEAAAEVAKRVRAEVAE